MASATSLPAQVRRLRGKDGADTCSQHVAPHGSPWADFGPRIVRVAAEETLQVSG